jgi:hypothetical protein
MHSLTLSTPYVSCHSYFSGDFKVYSDSVLTDDFWSVVTQFLLTIPCINDDSVFSIDFIRQSWISMCCRFRPSSVTQFQRWFLILYWLSFRWWFLDQHWHSVFDDSMRQTWIYFCYRFHASVVNSLTLSTPYVTCHSYYSGDFRVHSDSVFADDFCSVGTQFSLTIPCVNDDSVFSIDFLCQSWISLSCRFRSSAVTQFQTWFLILQWLSFRWWFLDQHWHSVFHDSMRQTWIYFCYRFHASVVNSLTLSTPYVSCHSYYSGDFRVHSDAVFGDDFWSVVTQFSPMIPCVNDDSVFSIDFLRQPWVSIRCWFPSSIVN